MSRTIELPEELYRAIEHYAANRGETAQAIILDWATTIQREVARTTTAVPTTREDGVNDPARDPWAGFRGATTALSSDSLDRHDAYFAEEYMKSHDMSLRGYFWLGRTRCARYS